MCHQNPQGIVEFALFVAVSHTDMRWGFVWFCVHCPVQLMTAYYISVACCWSGLQSILLFVFCYTWNCFTQSLYHILFVPLSIGSIKHCFCLSVAYIANNWRTRRPSMPKFGMKLPHLWCDLHISFKVKGSRAPGLLMVTHIVRHIFRMARPTNFKLGIQMGDDVPTSATGAVTSKVKGQGRKVTWSVWAVLAQCCTCVIRGQRGQPHFLLCMLIKTWLLSQHLLNGCKH